MNTTFNQAGRSNLATFLYLPSPFLYQLRQLPGMPQRSGGAPKQSEGVGAQRTMEGSDPDEESFGISLIMVLQVIINFYPCNRGDAIKFEAILKLKKLYICTFRTTIKSGLLYVYLKLALHAGVDI